MSETQAHQSSKATIRNVLRVAIILGIVTGIEFVVAFSMDASIVKTVIFVLLTVVKAFYIVGDFMHLSHEKKKFYMVRSLPHDLCRSIDFYSSL